VVRQKSVLQANEHPTSLVYLPHHGQLQQGQEDFHASEERPWLWGDYVGAPLNTRRYWAAGKPDCSGHGALLKRDIDLIRNNLKGKFSGKILAHKSTLNHAGLFALDGDLRLPKQSR
jgi:hypothetical protein